MKHTFICLVFIALILTAGHSQNISLSNSYSLLQQPPAHFNPYSEFSYFSLDDSIKHPSQFRLFLKEVRFVLNLDSRQSFIYEKRAKMNGLKMGLEFYDKYRFGLGWYKTDVPVPLAPIAIGTQDTLFQTLRFNYSTFYFEYVFYEDYKWEFSVPISLGGGKGNIDTISTIFDTVGVKSTEKMGVFTLSIGGHYKIFYWLGVGAGMGYRQMFANNKQIRETFNSPFYVIKAKLFLGGLYKTFFRREQVLAERNAYRQHRAKVKEKRKAAK